MARRRALRSGCAVLATLLLPLAGGAGEPWQPCPDSDWKTTGADAEEHAQVCRGVQAATETLAGCGIEVIRSGRVRLTAKSAWLPIRGSEADARTCLRDCGDLRHTFPAGGIVAIEAKSGSKRSA